MGGWLRKLGARFRLFHLRDHAQDLIEYALIAALISLLVIAGLGSVANELNSGIKNVGKKFKKHVDHGLHKGWYK